jgi:zinc protease
MSRLICRFLSRTAFVLAVAIVGAMPTATTAADPSPAEIVDLAIKATGGKEALAKQKAMTWSEKGTYYGMGGSLPYTANYASELPNKVRMEIVGVFTIVFDGKKGWTNSMGSVTDMTDEQVEEHKENAYANNLTTLLPLKKDDVKLESAGDGKVNDKDAVAIKVSSKDHRDVTLWFDKETHLLAKVESTIKAEEAGGKEMKQAITFSNYDEVEGIKMPKKYAVTRDGEKYVESEMASASILEKHDEGTFSKPE